MSLPLSLLVVPGASHARHGDVVIDDNVASPLRRDVRKSSSRRVVETRSREVGSSGEVCLHCGILPGWTRPSS